MRKQLSKRKNDSQAYFWTREWQAGEREADADIQVDRVEKFHRVKALMDNLRH